MDTASVATNVHWNAGTATGGNLKKLGMKKQYEELEAHTMAQMRRAETVANARHLVRDVESWMDQHGDGP